MGNNGNTTEAATRVASAGARAAASSGAPPALANEIGHAAGREVATGKGGNAGQAAASVASTNGMNTNAVEKIKKVVEDEASKNGVAQHTSNKAAVAGNRGAGLNGNGSNNKRSQHAWEANAQNYKADGRIGSYVPASTYLHGATLESATLAQDLMTRPKLGAACADSERGCTLFRGPADASPARPVASLFPLALESGDGFDEVLIDAPIDLLYADSLLGEDVNVLTTTRNQSLDLRGEPPIEAQYTMSKHGVSEAGSMLGAYQSSLGAYALRKPVRQFIA